MVQEFKTIGNIKFDPKAIRDPSGKMFKEWWVIVELDKNEIIDYYNWFMKREFGIKLQRPAFGPHVSLIRGEEINKEKWDIGKEKWDGTQVNIKYWSPPRTNGKHWWLRLSNEDEILDIREDIGYVRQGAWILHLTIGMPIPNDLEQSKYIWKLYKKNLLNYPYYTNTI